MEALHKVILVLPHAEIAAESVATIRIETAEDTVSVLVGIELFLLDRTLLGCRLAHAAVRHR